MKYPLSVLFIFCIAVSVHADLPVHCLYKTTKGEWTLELTSQDNDKTIVKKCDIRSDITRVKTLKITLQVPDVAVDQDGNKGFWTLIYGILKNLAKIPTHFS